MATDQENTRGEPAYIPIEIVRIREERDRRIARIERESPQVDEAAQEAKRALDSKEGAELKAAEAKGRAGDPKKWEKSPDRPK